MPVLIQNGHLLRACFALPPSVLTTAQWEKGPDIKMPILQRRELRLRIAECDLFKVIWLVSGKPGLKLKAPGSFSGGSGVSLPYSSLIRSGFLAGLSCILTVDLLLSLGQVCGVWRAVPRLSVRLLRAEQLHVALVTPTHPSGEVWGPLIWQGALAAGSGSKPSLLCPTAGWMEERIF